MELQILAMIMTQTQEKEYIINMVPYPRNKDHEQITLYFQFYNCWSVDIYVKMGHMTQMPYQSSWCIVLHGNTSTLHLSSGNVDISVFLRLNDNAKC